MRAYELLPDIWTNPGVIRKHFKPEGYRGVLPRRGYLIYSIPASLSALTASICR